MMTKSRIATNEFLTREISAAKKQVVIYQNNKGFVRLPKALTGRINWLLSYAKAIKHVDRMKKDGTLEGINLSNYEARLNESLDKAGIGNDF